MRRAYEKWLEEGWSLWRVAYSVVGLVVTAAAVFEYVKHPHRFTAWLTVIIAAIAVWAVIEMIRWRILFRRSQRAAAEAEAQHQRALEAQRAEPIAVAPTAPQEPWGMPMFNMIPGSGQYCMALQPTPVARIVSGLKCEVTRPRGGLPMECVIRGPVSPDGWRMCSYPSDFGLPADLPFEDGDYVIKWSVMDDQGTWRQASEDRKQMNAELNQVTGR